MALRLVNIDRDTPMLLPPGLREWVPEGHIVHFILDAGKVHDFGLRKDSEGNMSANKTADWPRTLQSALSGIILPE